MGATLTLHPAEPETYLVAPIRGEPFPYAASNHIAGVRRRRVVGWARPADANDEAAGAGWSPVLEAQPVALPPPAYRALESRGGAFVTACGLHIESEAELIAHWRKLDAVRGD
jgi:hypothetical protein